MATVLEECSTEEQCSVVRFFFCGKKRLNAKDIHKGMFSLYDGKCFSRKMFPSWRQHFADDEEVETELRKWLKQQSKDFYVVGFDVLVKRWDKCINVCGGYVEK
jgi:hypothetical protein